MIALVAGASRGCGKGIAIALADVGATVYCTGRTTDSGPAPVDQAAGTIEETAAEVTRRGGKGIAVRVDHTNPADVNALFEAITRDQERLDVAVCATWGANERYMEPIWQQPFWKQPLAGWDESLNAGAYAFWLVARGAVRRMERQGEGLIVGVTELTFENSATTPHTSMAEAFAHMGHYAINTLVRDLARDARTVGVTVVGLLPGFMKTERVQTHLKRMDQETRTKMRFDLAESPQYAGRAVVALATCTEPEFHNGQLLHVSDLSKRYGFTDIDGSRPGNFYRALGLIK